MILLNWMNGRLRNGMLASIALPLFIATVLGGALLLEESRDYRQSRSLVLKIDLIGKISGLIHEQQKERGATSIFISSDGQTFAKELAAQRKSTDAAAVDFQVALEDASIVKGSALDLELVEVAHVLTQRQTLRGRVDALDIPASEALNHYTAHNARMLRSINLIGSISQEPDVLIRIVALESLLSAKEFAGIERAIGSAGFASGGFSFARSLRLRDLVSRQDIGLVRFKNLSDEADIAALEDVSTLNGSQRLVQLRDIAMKAFESGDLQGVTGPDFFAATTERIDGFKRTEDALVGKVEALAKEHEKSALTAIALIGSALVLAFGCASVLTRYLITKMLMSVRAISDAGDLLAQGDQNAVLPKDSPAELGRIVWSIDFFRRSVIEGQEREAENVRQRSETEAKARAEQEQRQLAEKQRAEADASAVREEQQRAEVCAAEMSAVVAACATGDFSQRLNLDNKVGILGDMSEGINRISEVVEGSLNEVRCALSHLAQGDMSYEMTGPFEGIFAEIARAMSEANRNMANTIATVVGSASTVSESAMELSATTNDLAKRSERNAATLQQTTVSINDISRAINGAAEAAQSAQTNVVEVSKKASEGTVIAENTMRAMQNIQESSDGISRILGVIDEIAFQTNLLALNAGVEAARAGDAGRGFAVVASEVRGLALRSSDSSREITQLIDAATQSVSQGVQMVDQTVGSLSEIAGDLQGVERQIEQMAGSFQDTKRNVNEVSSSTASLDQTTQETAAMLEEANAAVQSLDNEARDLSHEVSKFRISEGRSEDDVAA